MYHAIPQIRGKAAHRSVDDRSYCSSRHVISGLAVYSEEFGVYGKIDIYKAQEKLLIERKYQLKTIYRGQIYQLWAQYFSMLEMGYQVERLEFHTQVSRTIHVVPIPDEKDILELNLFLNRFRTFDPTMPFHLNPAKCIHCIYCNLCDKTDSDNVYN